MEFVFDTSALHFGRLILPDVLAHHTITIPSHVANELASPPPKGIRVEALTEADRGEVAQLLGRYRGKDPTTNYLKGRRVQGLGEFTVIVAAKRLNATAVFHDARAIQIAQWERVASIALVDLPEVAGLPPSPRIEEFYRLLEAMRDPRALARRRRIGSGP